MKDIGKLLKKYGYSMPISEDEVVAFEKKFKKEYKSPKEWSSVDDILNKDLKESKIIFLEDKKINKASGSLSMAAREGKKITEEIREQMNKDKKDAQK